MKKDIKFALVLIISIIILLSFTLYEAGLERTSSIQFITLSITITIMIVIMCVFIYKEKNLNIQKAFLIVIPFICIMFFITMPIFRNHDEDNHWLRIYDIANGNLLVPTEYGHIFQAGATNYPATKVPRAVYDIINREKTAGHNFKELYQYTINEDDTIIVTLSTEALYSPLQYTPQVVGVSIANLFTDRPIIMAYAARLVNIITSIVVLYFAIKLMPFGKKVLLVIMAIPIAVEGFSSLSSDAMTISIAMLIIAYVFNIIFNTEKKKVNIKDKIILLILCIIISLCKIVYLPLVGLLLLLPKEKFTSKKDKIITIVVLILIAMIANLSWLGISSQYLAEYKEGRPIDQVKSIITNPIRYFQILFHSVNINADDYITSMFGGSLGLNEHIILNTITPYVFLFLSLMLGVVDSDIKQRLSKFQNWIIALIILAITVLIFTSLYIQWTPTESTRIAGVQGRYFIPFLPLAILLMGNLKIKAEYKEENIVKFISVTILLTQINVILSILSRNI